MKCRWAAIGVTCWEHLMQLHFISEARGKCIESSHFFLQPQSSLLFCTYSKQDIFTENGKSCLFAVGMVEWKAIWTISSTSAALLFPLRGDADPALLVMLNSKISKLTWYASGEEPWVFLDKRLLLVCEHATLYLLISCFSFRKNLLFSIFNDLSDETSRV